MLRDHTRFIYLNVNIIADVPQNYTVTSLISVNSFVPPVFLCLFPEGLPGGGGGPCSLVPFQNYPMFPCSHTFSECFRTVIFRILFPCSQKLANVPLFPSMICQCSLVPLNPWETLFPYNANPWYKMLDLFSVSHECHQIRIRWLGLHPLFHDS